MFARLKQSFVTVRGLTSLVGPQECKWCHFYHATATSSKHSRKVRRWAPRFWAEKSRRSFNLGQAKAQLFLCSALESTKGRWVDEYRTKHQAPDTRANLRNRFRSKTCLLCSSPASKLLAGQFPALWWASSSGGIVWFSQLSGLCLTREREYGHTEDEWSRGFCWEYV